MCDTLANLDQTKVLTIMYTPIATSEYATVLEIYSSWRENSFILGFCWIANFV